MKPAQATTQTHERICVYGDPKTGKTRLVTSLPWGEYWGDRAIYLGIDPSAGTLRSVLPGNREHLIPFEPEDRNLEEYVEMATKDWRAEFPEVRTIIWDTMTVTGKDLLASYANSGAFSDRHAVQLGKQGTKSWHTSPMQGDYGAAQNSVGFLLGHLWRQPLHVIVVFHAKWVEPQAGSPEGLAGGPDVVGSKAVRWISGHFDSVFRTDIGMDPRTRTSSFLVQTATKGIWKAGYRTGSKLPALTAAVSLHPDPSHFWTDYQADVTERKP